MRLPSHEATTAQLGAAYPFVAGSPLLEEGVLVGRDLHGGAFWHDPFALYAAGLLTNPNLLVLGQIGRGKSAFVKTYLYRHAAFGRRVVVLDPKGEYGPLAAALGVAPVVLRPGGSCRLNPLDGPPAATGRRLALLATLAGACLGRALAPAEHAGLEAALEAATTEVAGLRRPPVLPEVVAALLEPGPAAARLLRTDLPSLRAETRSVALALRRLVRGELRGMFDGPTTPGLELTGRAVVLDLSHLYRSPALAALVACTMAALESSWQAAAGQSLLVVDEAWAVLEDVGVARFLQSSWKLARAHGVANVAVVHRVSDLASAGDAGSVAAKVADGLLADSETLVCYAQSPAEVPLAARALGLGDRESRLLPRLPRGVALWRVAGRSWLVEHRIGPLEWSLVDTDAALVGRLEGTEA